MVLMPLKNTHKTNLQQIPNRKLIEHNLPNLSLLGHNCM